MLSRKGKGSVKKFTPAHNLKEKVLLTSAGREGCLSVEGSQALTRRVHASHWRDHQSLVCIHLGVGWKPSASSSTSHTAKSSSYYYKFSHFRTQRNHPDGWLEGRWPVPILVSMMGILGKVPRWCWCCWTKQALKSRQSCCLCCHVQCPSLQIKADMQKQCQPSACLTVCLWKACHITCIFMKLVKVLGIQGCG